MNTYKMRAECLSDVVGLAGFFNTARGNGVPIFRYTITNTDGQLGDVEVTFRATADLTDLRQLISQVIDGHCMLRTLNFSSQYTGEQYYFDGE